MEWNWTPEKTQRWLTPAVEIPYLAERWASLGFRDILDNGCGPGRHAVFLAGRGFSVTGLDQSPEALSYLRHWAEEAEVPVTAVSGDILSLPFPDASFDGILDYNVSYHGDTRAFLQALGELRRVLRPGGELYITLLSQSDPGFQSAPPESHLDEFTLMHAEGTPHFYGSRKTIPELFAGFTPAIPLREIRTAGLDNPKESTHFHLLLRKDEP